MKYFTKRKLFDSYLTKNTEFETVYSAIYSDMENGNRRQQQLSDDTLD